MPMARNASTVAPESQEGLKQKLYETRQKGPLSPEARISRRVET